MGILSQALFINHRVVSILISCFILKVQVLFTEFIPPLFNFIDIIFNKEVLSNWEIVCQYCSKERCPRYRQHNLMIFKFDQILDWNCWLKVLSFPRTLFHPGTTSKPISNGYGKFQFSISNGYGECQFSTSNGYGECQYEGVAHAPPSTSNGYGKCQYMMLTILIFVIDDLYNLH